jgi:DNA-binding YbaB/EbfC family protein
MPEDDAVIDPALLNRAKLMRSKITQAQENARQKNVSASSGGGMVTATASGGGQLVSLQIDPQVVDVQDIEMLTDLVISAVNQALARAQALVAEEMAAICAELPLPKLF